MAAKSSQLPILTALTNQFGDINAQLISRGIPVKVKVVIIEFTGSPDGDNTLTLTLSNDGQDWIFG